MKKLLALLFLLLPLSLMAQRTISVNTNGMITAPALAIYMPGSFSVSNGLYIEGPLTLKWTTISASDIDWNLNQARFKQLAGNTTFTFSNLTDDRDVVVALQQDGTGGRTVTWPGSIVFVNSTNQTAVPSVNTNANFYSLYHFWRRNSTVYCQGPSTAPSVFSVNFDAGTSTVADLQNQLSNGSTLVTTTGSQVLTSKTFDVANNILLMKGYIVLSHPHLVDGAGAILQTNDTTVAYFGQAQFANGTAASGNFIEYRITVPEDLDTTVDLKVERWKFRLGGSDTATHRYVISMQSVADSAAYVGTPANAVNMDFAGDASGANGDVETVSNITLTAWKSNVTPGALWVIRVARDGNNGADASTVSSYSGPLVLSYGVTQ